VPDHSAFALALLAHAGILAITSAGGLVSLARLGWRREEQAPMAEGIGRKGP
jgi:hypothetical protein